MIVFSAQSPASSYCIEAKKDSLRISELPVYGSLMPGNVFKFGIQTGFIFTRHLDTGVDCGGRISQRFFHPYFQLTSQIHFWTASQKKINETIAAIEESITYQIPVYRRLNIFGGFALSYLGAYRTETTTSEEGKTTDIETKKNAFEPFVTSGIEYALERNRSFFMEFKYGKTIISREFHVIFGLNFFLKK